MPITPDAIAKAIETAPAWAQMALTDSKEQLREDARLEVGRHVYDALFQPMRAVATQLALPL